MTKWHEHWQNIQANLLTLQHSDDPNMKRTRRGSVFVIGGVTVALLGGGMVYNNHAEKASANTYESVQVSYKTGMQQFKKAQSNQEDVTLVLHRTGCKACESVKTFVSDRVQKLRADNPDTKYIVLDLTKLNKSQTDELKTLMPSVLINGEIPSPAIVDMSQGVSGYIVTDKSLGTDKTTIKHVLD